MTREVTSVARVFGVRSLWRSALVLAAVAAIVVLLGVLRDGEGTQPAPRAEPWVLVEIDARSSTITRATVTRGTRVVLSLVGPPGKEVHLHGYDQRLKLPGRLGFRATIPGRFAVELEATHTRIAELTVVRP